MDICKLAVKKFANAIMERVRVFRLDGKSFAKPIPSREEVERIVGSFINDAEKFNQQVHYLFMGCGTEENFGTQAMVKELQGMGIDAHLYESQGTAHEWLTWRRCLHEFLPHLFKK